MRLTDNYSLGSWIRVRREVRGATQAELADYVGVRQSIVSAIESDRQSPEPDLLGHLERALALPPGEILAARREQLKTALRAYGLRHLRVFGSVARHEDHIDSDLDLLAECRGSLLLTASHSTERAEQLLTVPVDVVCDQELNPSRPKTSIIYEQAATL